LWIRLPRLIPGAVGQPEIRPAGVVHRAVAGQAKLAGDGRVRRAFPADCSIIRITRGRRSIAAWRCRKLREAGNHDQIRELAPAKRALDKTLRNRPDLLERFALSEEDRELLAQIKRDQSTARD